MTENEFQRDCNCYGDEEIDKSGWLKWEQELIAERERRKEEREKGKNEK